MYEFRQFQHQFKQLEFKMPAGHLMGRDQYADYLRAYHQKLITFSEMPPVYLPHVDNGFRYKFQVFFLLSKVSPLTG